MQKINVFKTITGEIFEREEDAILHEKRMEKFQYYRLKYDGIKRSGGYGIIEYRKESLIVAENLQTEQVYNFVFKKFGFPVVKVSATNDSLDWILSELNGEECKNLLDLFNRFEDKILLTQKETSFANLPIGNYYDGTVVKGELWITQN